MNNFYEILNLSSDCSTNEIKKQYRILAKKHHPDKGGDKEFFIKINNAYNILVDETKRKEYDIIYHSMFPFSKKEVGDWEHSTEMKFYKNFWTFNFSDLFGNKKTKDKSLVLNVTLSELYDGCEKELFYYRNVLCKQCTYKKNGIGVIEKKDCSWCDKSRQLYGRKKINVLIPKFYDKKTITIKNKSDQNVGFITGDIIVKLNLLNDRNFSLDGELGDLKTKNLIYEKKIKLIDVLENKPIVIQHLNGKKYTINNRTSQEGYDEIINQNTEIILNGLGFSYEQSNFMKVTFKIIFPKKINSEFCIRLLFHHSKNIKL